MYCSLVVTVFSCFTNDNPVNPDPGADFKAMLQTLNWGGDTCFVYGHKTPDVDAVTSALSYAKLMNVLGYVCKQSEMDAFMTRMLAAMPEVMMLKGRQMLFAKIDNLVPNTGSDKNVKPYVEGGTYFIYCGDGTKQVAEAVFGPSLREGVCYTEENLSRKQIVPRITEVISIVK